MKLLSLVALAILFSQAAIAAKGDRLDLTATMALFECENFLPTAKCSSNPIVQPVSIKLDETKDKGIRKIGFFEDEWELEGMNFKGSFAAMWSSKNEWFIMASIRRFEGGKEMLPLVEIGFPTMSQDKFKSKETYGERVTISGVPYRLFLRISPGAP